MTHCGHEALARHSIQAIQRNEKHYLKHLETLRILADIETKAGSVCVCKPSVKNPQNEHVYSLVFNGPIKDPGEENVLAYICKRSIKNPHEGTVY